MSEAARKKRFQQKSNKKRILLGVVAGRFLVFVV